MKKRGTEVTARTDDAQDINDQLLGLQTQLLPMYGPNWHRHSVVAMKVEAVARLLYYADIYKLIVDVPGVVCEFGVQWGATMAQLINLRSIFEPFNHSRTIYGFDTFSGFPSVATEDGLDTAIGDYSTTAGFKDTLDRILTLHEAAAPMNHLRKFDLVEGDVSVTFPQWTAANPHAIIALAIFDMDLYRPTRDVLDRIVPFLTKGSVLVFDEINCRHFPGETIALREAIGTHALRLRRMPSQPFCSWAVWGE